MKPRRFRRDPRAAVPIQFALLWLISRPFVWLYQGIDLVFDLKKRGAASNLKRLSKEVESECADLFRRYGGRIVPERSSGHPAMDFATVEVVVGSLQLRAIRDRGFTGWEISTAGSGDPWQPLDAVCQRFAPDSVWMPASMQLLVEHFREIELSLQRSH